jgi:hypothetical protein
MDRRSINQGLNFTVLVPDNPPLGATAPKNHPLHSRILTGGPLRLIWRDLNTPISLGGPKYMWVPSVAEFRVNLGLFWFEPKK